MDKKKGNPGLKERIRELDTKRDGPADKHPSSSARIGAPDLSRCRPFQSAKKNVLFNSQSIFASKKRGTVQTKNRLFGSAFTTATRSLAIKKHKNTHLPATYLQASEESKAFTNNAQSTETFGRDPKAPEVPLFVEPAALNVSTLETSLSKAHLHTVSDGLGKYKLEYEAVLNSTEAAARDNSSASSKNTENFESFCQAPDTSGILRFDKLTSLSGIVDTGSARAGDSEFGKSFLKSVDDAPAFGNLYDSNTMAPNDDYVSFSQDEAFDSDANKDDTTEIFENYYSINGVEIVKTGFNSAADHGYFGSTSKIGDQNLQHVASEKLCLQECSVIPLGTSQYKDSDFRSNLLSKWKSTFEMIRSNQNILIHSLNVAASQLRGGAKVANGAKPRKSLSSTVLPDWKLSIIAAENCPGHSSLVKVYARIDKYPKTMLDKTTRVLIKGGAINTAAVFISLFAVDDFKDLNSRVLETVANFGGFDEDAQSCCARCNGRCVNFLTMRLLHALNSFEVSSNKLVNVAGGASNSLLLNVFSHWSYYTTTGGEDMMPVTKVPLRGSKPYGVSSSNSHYITHAPSQDPSLPKIDYERAQSTGLKNLLFITSTNFTITPSE